MKLLAVFFFFIAVKELLRKEGEIAIQCLVIGITQSYPSVVPKIHTSHYTVLSFSGYFILMLSFTSRNSGQCQFALVIAILLFFLGVSFNCYFHFKICHFSTLQELLDGDSGVIMAYSLVFYRKVTLQHLSCFPLLLPSCFLLERIWGGSEGRGKRAKASLALCFLKVGWFCLGQGKPQHTFHDIFERGGCRFL